MSKVWTTWKYVVEITLSMWYFSCYYFTDKFRSLTKMHKGKCHIHIYTLLVKYNCVCYQEIHRHIVSLTSKCFICIFYILSEKSVFQLWKKFISSSCRLWNTNSSPWQYHTECWNNTGRHCHHFLWQRLLPEWDRRDDLWNRRVDNKYIMCSSRYTMTFKADFSSSLW